ncbi:uncharacterized protein STEHIDRAFT_124187 [Stereum hirsutum FP-91666 SS1]|uniref:uncharacterized protein n=1 Tax=Stereum hirsutum (strain FP-91666) TaxID=721885 RepID=UPI0004449A34|nr:uncharacterized protein STEHIDRAFT_124187 [Stereum hirsutum FP-91666 SS1]EIM82865.1 hypothetical protein STEHIDRAFT_124187 [Stereum hirsutum FP-91666 SS1]
MAVINDDKRRLTLVDVSRFSDAWTGRAAVLPTCEAELSEWFSLALNEARTGNSYPLHIVRAGTNEDVRLWVQGVVLERLLRNEGSKGLGLDDEVEPWFGCQGIRLGAGWSDWGPAFKKQMDAIRMIVNSVFLKLALPRLDTDVPETLFLRHVTEDWGGVPFGVQSLTEDGHVCECSKSMMSRGDVVEMRIIPQVALVVGLDGLPRTNIFFDWDKIVKIRDRSWFLKVRFHLSQSS